MYTTLTRETLIWMEWETCVITALWNIIPIRCVKANTHIVEALSHCVKVEYAHEGHISSVRCFFFGLGVFSMAH